MTQKQLDKIGDIGVKALTILFAFYVSIVATLTLLHSYKPDLILKSLSKIFVIILAVFFGCTPRVVEKTILAERIDSVYIPGDTVFIQSKSDNVFIARDSSGNITDINAYIDTTINNINLKLGYSVSADHWTARITKYDTVIKFKIIDTSKQVIVDKIIEKTPLWVYPLLAVVALVVIFVTILIIKVRI